MAKDFGTSGIEQTRYAPTPGRVHGSGGRVRRNKDNGQWVNWIDKRPSVNKVNPYIRGQSNAVQGRFIESHDSDDTNPIQAASVTGNHQSNIKPRRVYRPLRSKLS